MVAQVREKKYFKYTSEIVAVGSEALIENINPSFTNHVVGIQYFSDALGTTPVGPTAGTVRIEVKNNVTELWEDALGSPFHAVLNKDTFVVNYGITDCRANSDSITGASYYRLVVASSDHAASDDNVGMSGRSLLPMDFEGKQAFNTIFGEQVVGIRDDDVSVQFQYNNSTRDVTVTETGTGVVSNSESLAVLSTGTGVGLAEFSTVDAVRYRPGHEVTCMFTAIFSDTPESGVRQQVGLFNGSDGVSIGYDGEHEAVFLINDSVETIVLRDDWNQDKLDGTGKSGYSLDFSTLNIFKISYGWLGISPITVSVYCGYERGWVQVHVFDFTNERTSPHLRNPSLPVSARVERASGSGSDISIKTASMRAGIVEGIREHNSSSRVFSYTVLDKTIGTTEVPVLTIRSKSTYQGKTNHVKAELLIVRFVTDGTKSVVFRGYKGASLVGASFVDLDTDNSVMEVDVSATSFSGGTEGAATVLGKVDSLRADVRGTGLVINPEDSFLITAVTSSGSSDVSVSIREAEFF